MTKLTRETRVPEICIDLLRAAREELASWSLSETAGLCWALARAEDILAARGGRLACLEQNGDYLRAYIRKQLAYCSDLDQWLWATRKTRMTPQQLRDARLQWIDWMIDQLRSEPTG